MRRLWSNKVAIVSISIFIIICLACLFAPYLTKYTYRDISIDRILLPPSFAHPFGCDNLGRDLFTRMLYGGRVTLRITLTASVMAAVVGSAIGLIAGYFGGIVDRLISPVLDVLASIPVFLLIIVVEYVLGWGQGTFMYALAIAAVPQFARVVRGSVMSVVGSEYIEAARALGVRHPMIIIRHVLHNVAAPMIIRFTSGVAEMLLMCTILGYLSVGIGPPTPEWGSIAQTGRGHVRLNPHLMLIPCAIITTCVVSLSLFGDGVRDALDPRGQYKMKKIKKKV